MSDVQTNDPTQTQIDNQNVKTDDEASKSSAPTLQTDVTQSDQTTTSNKSTNDNPSTSEPSSDAKTNTISPTNNETSTTVAQETSSPPDLETPATQTPELDADKQALQTEVQRTNTTKASTSEIPDSDANKQSLPNDVQPENTTKTSEAQIPESDANKQSSPTEAPLDSTTTPSAAQIPETDANEVQPDNTTKPSETQIPESDANKPSSPTEAPPVSTTTPSTSQIPETDGNKESPTTEVQPINTTETSTTKTPDSSANKQSLPEEGQQATQVPESSTNKQATPIPTQESGESSKTKEITSDKETTSDHHIDPHKAGNETDTKETQNKNDKSEIQPSPEQERKQLVNLILQELYFVNSICPKLGEHQKKLKAEAKDASKKFESFDENCEIKELKDLKKTVTKLKLQIPAKYRTYDEDERRKKKQSAADTRDIIPPKLLRKMPRLHNNLFNESQICRTIQQRYSELTRELKICLLCFSVFPENEIISRRLMVYWWIGEGLTPSDEDLNEEKTAEDHANDMFNKLIDKDFIEPVPKKNHDRYVAACKMHPMVRAALIMIADKIRFFDFDEFGDPKDVGKFDEIESPEEIPDIYPLGDPREFFDFYDENYKPTTKTIEFADQNKNPIKFAALPPNEEDYGKEPPVDSNGTPIDTTKKHYFYRRKKITTKSYKVCLMGSGLSKGVTWEKLHMLFNVKDDILEFKREWFLRMKNVNVLFLGRWQSSAAHHIEVEEFDFKTSLDNMNHVRFFSLQGVSRITVLPESISKLESLIILDLRACHNLEVIPSTIGSLNFLTHLDMSECYLLKDIPKEISSLASLQVLKGFVVVDSPQRHVCTLQDLEKLKNLIKLSMYTHMKDFPRASHLEALQKFEMLRKLTILWGGHDEKPEPNQQVTNQKDKKKGGLRSRVRELITKKKWVQGSMRRMNAFNNSTLGSRLEKLDLKCFPESETPNWLTPARLQGLKKLYIRGGKFSDLGQYQDIYDVDDSPIQQKQTWNVKVLRLKYLEELKMEWRELQNLFPKMASLEKVKCPKLTLFPCNERGVWNKEPTTT